MCNLPILIDLFGWKLNDIQNVISIVCTDPYQHIPRKRSENGAKRAVPVAVQCSGVSVSVHQENANNPV